MDSHVGTTLLYGLLLSITVMLAGLLYSLARGTSVSGQVLPLDRVPGQLGRGNPSAVLDLGILLLFATPLAAVVVALLDFLQARDRPFAAIAVLLLALLVVGVLVALR